MTRHRRRAGRRRRRAYGDALLRVVVTEPARAGLGDEVRALLPNAIDVQVARAGRRRRDAPAVATAGRTTAELFHQYLAERDVDDPAVEALFAELLDARRHRGRRLMRPLQLAHAGLRRVPRRDRWSTSPTPTCSPSSGPPARASRR